MNSIFYHCVTNSFKKHNLQENYNVDLSESIILSQYQDQIVVLKSKVLKLGVVLEKEQVQFLVSRVDSSEWFDLSSLAYFFSKGHDDWVFENLKPPLSSENIESRIDELIGIFQKYHREIIQLFTSKEESTIAMLKESMNKRWEERRKKLKRKMRFPFF